MRKQGAASITGALFSLFIALGVSSTLFGLIMPDVTNELGISLAYAGLVTTLFAIGRTSGSFVAGFATDRRGERIVTLYGVALMLIGLAFVSGASHIGLFFAGSALMGCGFGALDVTANTSITALHPKNRASMLSLLHGFYGVGSFIGPLILGAVLAWQPSWRAASWTVGLLYFLAGVAYAVFVRSSGDLFEPRPTVATSSHEPDPGSQKAGRPSFLSLLRQPAFLLIVPIGFIYQGVSWSLSLWLPTFMTDVHGASPLEAASAVSALFLGLTVGRFVNSIITRWLGDGNTLLLGAIGALFSLTLSLLAPTLLITFIALAVTGFSMSSLIPTSIAILTRLTPNAEGTASGTFMTLSATGVLIFPWLLGILSEHWGMRAGLGAGIVALLVMVVVVIVLRRMLGTGVVHETPAQT